MKMNKTKIVSDKKERNRMRTDSFCLAALLHNLKKLFLPWLIIAVVAAGIIVGSNSFFSNKVDALSSTISFYYNGIEKGLDPNGCEFDKNSIKDDEIVLAALEELGLSAELLVPVQNGISIDSVVSSSAIDSITQYSSVYDKSGSLSNSTVNDSSYHATAYNISFNYSAAKLPGETAADLINLILEKYQASFIETYGYNESVGNSILNFDFENYDYLIALDVYCSKLEAMENYVNALDENDTVQFRSEETGYSFSDISDSINLIRVIDIDSLISYILNNGVMSDKEMILSYYEFRLADLKRCKQNISEKIVSVDDSIEQYQKDAVIIYEDASNTSTVTQTSTVYDELIQRKLLLRDTAATYDSQISDYNARIAAIEKSSDKSTSSDKEYVEGKLVELKAKVSSLVENVKLTADDYYQNNKFLNAVTIASPAKYSAGQYIKSALSESIRLIIIAELFIVIIYLTAAIVFCFGSKIKSAYKHFVVNS